MTAKIPSALVDPVERIIIIPEGMYFQKVVHALEEMDFNLYEATTRKGQTVYKLIKKG